MKKTCLALVLVCVFSFVLSVRESAADKLHDAVVALDKAKVEVLLKSGADVNAKNKFGDTPLCRAAELWAANEIAVLLIKKGANIEAVCDGGRTALHRAVISENKEVAELLLSKGAKTNVKDRLGNTTLHWCVTSLLCNDKNKEFLVSLIDKGADVHAKNNMGNTPLDEAKDMSGADNKEVIKYLQSAMSGKGKPAASKPAK